MELQLIKEKFVELVYLSDEMVNMNILNHAEFDDFGAKWVLHVMIEEYHARIGEDVKYPANWKEAIKERFAPKWLLSKYPVRYNMVERFIAFPELTLKKLKKLGRIEYEIRVNGNL